MNAGEAVVEWLFSEQLKVDSEWSVRTPAGFKWWADQHCQTVEVIGEETDPETGDMGYYLSIRTEFLKNLELDERSCTGINAAVRPLLALAGPVYDPKSRTLDLCSLVLVHEGNRSWIGLLMSIASTLQIYEAKTHAESVGTLCKGKAAISGHPDQGMRPEPDEMATIVETLVAPLGQEPSKWSASEFQTAVDEYMMKPPALMANSGDLGLTVEFPYGAESSLCEMRADAPHPRYGNGLLLLQSFPVAKQTPEEGSRLALSLNAKELTQRPRGYGLGSYTFRDDTIYFSSFVPNVCYPQFLLANWYFSAGNRAENMSEELLGQRWTQAIDPYTPKRSAVGRMLDGIFRRGEMYYENGQVKQKATLKDGKFDGPYEMYHENGQVKERGTFKDGERYGPYEMYHENGQLEQKGTYKDGKGTGLFEMYHKNGQLKEKATLKDGEFDGPLEMYYENGQLKLKGTCNMGEKCGEWIEEGETVTYDPCPDGVNE
jgi:hypothetical protein